MNLAPYYYLTKMRILTNLAYRFDVLVSIGTNLVLMVTAVFLWEAAFSSVQEKNGMGVRDMVTYSIVSTLLGTLFVCGVQDTIYNKVREGQIATDFYKPIPLLAVYFADDLGAVASDFMIKAIPLLISGAIFFGLPLPESPLSFLLFLPSCVFSYVILWFLSAIVGLLAFWVMELGNMGMVKDAIVRVLSGSFVPIWFFPEPLQWISKFLPFQYTYQTPLGIYIGVIGYEQALREMGIQLIWAAVLFLVLALFWRITKKKTLIQGG